VCDFMRWPWVTWCHVLTSCVRAVGVFAGLCIGLELPFAVVATTRVDASVGHSGLCRPKVTQVAPSPASRQAAHAGGSPPQHQHRATNLRVKPGVTPCRRCLILFGP